MDIFIFVFGLFLLVLGLIGCWLPVLPGPPLCFVALLIQQFKTEPPFSSSFLWAWAGITVVVTLMDYVIPLFGIKHFGGTQYGLWGCVIGLLAGFWFGPVGIIAGPFLGAFVGEIIIQQDVNKSFKAAFGAFIGFMLSSLLKFVTCFLMGYYLLVK